METMKQPGELVVARIETQDLLEWHSQLRDQLVIGDGCQDGERQAFIQLLCARHHVCFVKIKEGEDIRQETDVSK